MTKLIMLLKGAAEQIGLFDTLVPVKASVRKDGTVIPAHTARRKKRLKVVTSQPQGATEAPEQGALFDKPAVKTAPEKTATKPVSVKPRKQSKPAAQPAKRAAPVIADEPAGVDYGLPFESLPIPAFGVAPGTTKAQRKKLNTQARDLLREKADDELTGADKAVLAQYSGTGGVGDSLNEFYTRPDVAAAMWKILNTFGIRDGDVLEPSCGTGVFMKTAPAAVKVAGVELDGTSARIASVLHGRAEVTESSLEVFATQDARQFDAVIGNVPFGLRGASIGADKKHLPSAEQYFLDTAIDKAKSEGIVALIVPTGIMENRNTRSFRERLLRKAEFVGAMRLPNTAFEASHTEVTTDIVIFRKRPGDVAGALGAVDQQALKDLGVWDDEFLSGGYFAGRGKNNVFGRPEAGWRSKAGIGNDFTVTGSMAGVAAEISQFANSESAAGPTMADILATAGDDEVQAQRIRTAALKRPYEVAKPGDTKVIDGITYVLQGEPPRWHRVSDQPADAEALTDARAVAERLDTMFSGSEFGREQDRAEVIAALDAFVEAHGAPAGNPDLIAAARDDKVLWRLLGAVNRDGSYSDMVTGRKDTAGPKDFDSVAARLALLQGGFTADDVAAEWTDGDREAALDRLFASPQYAVEADGKTWTTLDSYLTGELWPKFDAARAELEHEGLAEHYKAKYRAQVEALEAAIDPKGLEDVEITLASGWIPADVITAWSAALVDEWQTQNPSANWEPEPLTVTFENGVYELSGDLVGAGYSAKSLLKQYLNRTGVKKDDWPHVEAMNEQFKQWLLGSDERDRVEDLYNRTFRGFRQKAHSDAPLAIPGINPAMDVNAYHFAGLRWALDAGKGIIAADVGLGKTLRGLALAKLLKAHGQAKKPTFVVPKSVLANWVAEAETWFPGARILTIGETYSRDKNGELAGTTDTKAERDRKFHELSQNDYDFVFLSQPVWNELDLNPIPKGEYVEGDFWTQRADSLGHAGDKRLNKIRTAYDQAVAKREFDKRTDVIYFDDLGIDALLLDEGHAYKNLFAARNRFGQQPKFLGGSGLSNRAQDTYFKTRYLREHFGDKGVFMLTATPTKNSPLEIYSMLSHVAPEEFTLRGIKNSEDFLDRYCEFKQEQILTVDGQIKESPVVTGFKNLDELREVMRKYIDRKTAEDVGLPLPERHDEMHMVDMSPAQEQVYEGLRQEAEAAGKDREATGDAHIFSIMDRMAKAAIDLELLDPDHYKGHVSPKLTEAADTIFTNAKDGGQVVFCDHNDLHEKIAGLLVDRGLNRNEIAIVNAKAASTSAKRQAISDKFNAGKYKVVIGNTATMGEGMNLQKRTADVHDLTIPWEPASLQQRHGRGLRQGNENEAVRIHPYLSKGSFDGYRWQTVSAKRDWQDVLWNGGDKVENLARESMGSREEMMILLSADPDAARKQYEENKAAALERQQAKGREAANELFLRFQEMHRSYGQLKDKESKSAQRLATRMARAKERLSTHKYFPAAAKQALESGKPAVLQSETGHVWHAGTAFEMDGGHEAPLYYSDSPSRWVVTGADPLAGTVTARPYGKLGDGRQFDIDKMNHGVKPIEYSEADEHAHIEKAAAERAEAGAHAADDPAGLRDAPEALLRKLYNPIQASLKDAAKSYRGNWRNAVGLLDNDGQPVAAKSYDARKMIDSHEVIIPLPEHRKKVMQAWMDMERAKSFKVNFVETRRRRYGGSEARGVKAAYPDWEYGSYTGNPWEHIGTELFSVTFMHEARAKFADEQIARADKAESFGAAMSVLSKLASADYSGDVVFGTETLEAIARQAEKHGVLDQPLLESTGAVDRYHTSDADMLTRQFFANHRGSVRNWLLSKPRLGAALREALQDDG
ncbi:MAG TPA: SNF2-related protein [Gammaproteobacteria bacterium]|nr:SNF2-related protein [Gammaproteobacteria bacterium]